MRQLKTAKKLKTIDQFHNMEVSPQESQRQYKEEVEAYNTEKSDRFGLFQ
jgi:hypothetical protein